MINLKCPAGKTIVTDLTPEVEKILKNQGYSWLEIIKKGTIFLSNETFNQIDSLFIPKAD